MRCLLLVIRVMNHLTGLFSNLWKCENLTITVTLLDGHLMLGPVGDRYRQVLLYFTTYSFFILFYFIFHFSIFLRAC